MSSMSANVFVKVVGFRDVERHALNTLFRLSAGRATSYCLWTPEAPVAPLLALIDLDAYEAGLELTSPGLNPKLKMICVGDGAPANAWRQFERPLHWPDVLQAMDSLFERATSGDDPVDFEDTETGTEAPTGFKVSLLVDPHPEDRLYLRARLALAGHTEVDDAGTGAQALELAKNRHYDLVVVGLEAPDMDGWDLIRQLLALEPPIGCVIVTTADKSLQTHERIEALGCHGLLEKPYDPLHIVELMEKI